MRKMKSFYYIAATTLLLLTAFGLVGARYRSSPSSSLDVLLITDVSPKSFDIKVAAVGNLEASRSHIIASSIRGDQGKLIYLIPEGSRVNKGDLLVKMDPTPFEEAISLLQDKLRVKENSLETLIKGLEWEKHQVSFDLKSAECEIETAELELNRITNGDGPQEIAKLQSNMQKAEVKYKEIEGYMEDLAALEKEGFLNPSEIKQARRKFEEEKDGYENAKLQYDSYVNYVHPMQIKKAETSLKRALNKKDEVIRAGEYRLEKESSLLNLGQQELADLKNGLHSARNDLLISEIRAPTSGMVVHKEEFRGGQRRKPRLGDVLIKNQGLLDLPDLESLTVKTRVREVDLCKIQVGLPVTIKVDAYPHLILAGHVSSIGVLALADLQHGGDEKYFEVMVSLDSTDPNLRPGMTSRLTIHSATVIDALSVPVHAVFEYAKQTYCYQVENGQFVVTPVTVGHCNEEWAEITSGLEAGQHVSLTQPPADQVIDRFGFLGKKT